MSSAGTPAATSASAASATQVLYFCHNCNRKVSLTPSTSPDAKLVCPDCNGEFLEETDATPASSSNHGITLSENPPAANPASSSNPGITLSGNPPAATPASSSNPGITLSENPPAAVAGSSSPARAAGAGDYDLSYFDTLMDWMTNSSDWDDDAGTQHGTPPASKSAVEGLPDIEITEDISKASDPSKCAVCKEKYALKGKAKQMPCKHIFHAHCLLPWLERRNSCPACRYELPTDDQSYENWKAGQLIDIDDVTTGQAGLSLGLGLDESPASMDAWRRISMSLPPSFLGPDAQEGTSNSAGGGDPAISDGADNETVDKNSDGADNETVDKESNSGSGATGGAD